MRRLKPLYHLLIIALLATIPFFAKAAEIMVPPGTGTLTDAVASAVNGDTLILQDGGYSGNVVVNKSLTIRPQYRSTQAVVVDTMTIDGVGGIEVTVQGLEFRKDIVLRRAAAIRILENHWTVNGINAGNYTTSQGVGSLVIIGNRFGSGSIRNISSDNAYIAGNELLNGRITISSNASVWIVGNYLRTIRAPFISGHPTIYQSGLGLPVRVIGNRIKCDGEGVNWPRHRCIELHSGLIANNVIGLSQQIGSHSSYRFIELSGSGTVHITNNIIESISSRPDAVLMGRPARFSGNIITGFQGFWRGTIPEDFAIDYNLCFNNSWQCSGNGNLDADPLFINRIDYRLKANSPAIDAGPPDFELADLDRTRNDMGVYGGPWSIDQFDAQRDPQSLAPYVYPLFTGRLISGNELQLRAIGVARFR